MILNRKIIAAVEIGTTKVVALVGEIRGKHCLNLIGYSRQPSQGVKKGEIIDFRAASTAVHTALAEAEKQTKTTIEGVYLAQSGEHLRSFATRGRATVRSPDGIVSRDDIQHAIAEAKRKELPTDRIYIQHCLSGFYLDGRKVKNPYAMHGEQLEAAYWHIHSQEGKMRDPLHVINGFNIKVEKVLVSSLASASIIAREEEKKNGTLILDIGAGTTDYVVYHDHSIIDSGVIAVGGDHLTNDLSLGLRISTKQAERIKCDSGKAQIDPKDNKETLWLFGDQSIGDRQIPCKAIYQILQIRLEELFTIIKKKITTKVPNIALAGGILLTGGTAHLPRIGHEAARVFNTRARIAQADNALKKDLDQPEYTTALGLLHYGMREQKIKYATQNRSGLLSRITHALSWK